MKKNILVVNDNIKTYYNLQNKFCKLQSSIQRKEHLTNKTKKNLELISFFKQYQDQKNLELISFFKQYQDQKNNSSYLIPIIIYYCRDLTKELNNYRNL